jgi:hypothetical protein
MPIVFVGTIFVLTAKFFIYGDSDKTPKE